MNWNSRYEEYNPGDKVVVIDIIKELPTTYIPFSIGDILILEDDGGIRTIPSGKYEGRKVHVWKVEEHSNTFIWQEEFKRLEE